MPDRTAFIFHGYKLALIAYRRIWYGWSGWHSISYQMSTITPSTMWTTTHFPAAMRSLNPGTRAKAIEIANQLLEQGQVDQKNIVAISVDEARRWARNTRPTGESRINPVRTYAR